MHTGQSDPNMSRLGPNHWRRFCTYGTRSSGVQRYQSASVIIPETFTQTFGWKDNGFIRDVHGSISRRAMSGLAM